MVEQAAQDMFNEAMNDLHSVRDSIRNANRDGSVKWRDMAIVQATDAIAKLAEFIELALVDTKSAPALAPAEPERPNGGGSDQWQV